jgi:plasmid stabilization system protein ParE
LNLSILPVAELEAAQAAIWYEEQRIGLGDEFLDDLRAAFERIHEMPNLFPVLEHYSGTHNVRRCQLKRYPYLTIFANRPEELLIVAVAHVRRRPLYWLERLG